MSEPKWQAMLRLQGDDEQQRQWLAAHVGKLYRLIGKLKRDIAAIKADQTRRRNRERRSN